MAKIVIEIDDKTFGRIFHRDCIGEEYDYEVTRAIVNGTKLPDNATNGDVIKALFPSLNNSATYDNGVVRIFNPVDKMADIATNTDWLHRAYKVGDTDESDAEFMCKAMSKTVNKSIADNNFIGGF